MPRKLDRSGEDLVGSGLKTRTQILQWLQDHGGQKDYKEEYVDVPNPDYDPSDTQYGGAKTIRVKKVTWVGNDGKMLSVYDRGEYVTDTEQSRQGAEGYESVYEISREGDPDNTDPRSPEKRREDEIARDEKEWNRANGPIPDKSSPAYNPDDEGRGSGLYETHATRAKRESDEREQRQRDEDAATRRRIEEQNQRNRGAELEISRAQQAEQARHNREVEAQQAAARETDKERIEIERAKEARANRTPNIIGNPSDTQKGVMYIDPATGEIKSQDNPLYDEKKAESERKREELRLAIEHNKMTAEQAAAEYRMWYDKNVAAPLALAQERRAQAEERRKAQEAQDRREQAIAQNKIERARIGETAAQRAVQAEQSLLPYRVGKTFSGNFANAINSLAAGGKMDANAAAGINFQASDFTFKSPNFAKIAKQAAKEALKHLTPYDPDEDEYATADYEGIGMPDASVFGSAPASPSFIDTTSQINQLISPYTAPTSR